MINNTNQIPTSLSLKQRTVKGVAWNLIERIGLQLIQFLMGICLARLLMPEDFGLIGMISVFLAITTVFVESGFGTAYIQKKKVNQVDANTVFYSNLVISFVCYACLWLAAPSISAFYERSELIYLIRVMSVVVIINAFNIIQMAQLTRAIDFKRKTKITLAATVISGIASIVAAFLGLGVWSLVLQQMLFRFLITTGMWLTSSWRPGLQFSAVSFRSLFSFGIWVLAANTVHTIFDNIYILTIGKFFPMAQLGFYSQAKMFQMLSAQQLTGAVGVVAFPVLSQMQDNVPRLKEGIRRFLTHTMVFNAPLQVTFMVVAEPFVLVLLTEKWAPMIPYLQLLCLAGLLYPIHLINVQVLIAQGKSNLHFRITVIKNTLRILNIVLMYRFGVVYIIIGEVLISYLSLSINIFYTKRLVGYGLWSQLNDIKNILNPAFLSGVFGAMVVYVIPNIYFGLFAGLSITLFSYFFLLYLFNRVFFMELLRLKENFIRQKK